GKCVGLHRARYLGIHLALEALEFLNRKHRVVRIECDAGHIGGRYPSTLHVVIGDGNAERIGAVDDHRQLRGVEATMHRSVNRRSDGAAWVTNSQTSEDE